MFLREVSVILTNHCALFIAKSDKNFLLLNRQAEQFFRPEVTSLLY